MSKTLIQWTHSSWNPVTGCDHVSPGCDHCYAERMAHRLQAMGVAKYRHGFKVTLHPDILDQPLHWKTPRLIFINSMSDLFHPDIPLGFVRQVFDTIKRAHWHQFQLLTKRSKRLVRLSGKLDWPPNLWMGVTVELRDYLYRIDDLRRTPATIKWLSLEPLLGDLGEVNLSGIDWAVVGGESGPGARPMKRQWVTCLRAQCRHQHVPFFFKQWGGPNKKTTGRLLDGREYSEYPAIEGFQPSLGL
jgi:protein gp37